MRKASEGRQTLSDAVNVARQKVSQKYGEEFTATAMANEFRKNPIHSGDIQLDLNLRPTFGSRITVVGEQHMGKTATLYRLLGAIQRTCRMCMTPIIPFLDEKTGEVQSTCMCGACVPCSAMYLDLELEFDPAWAKTLGVQIGTGLGDTDIEPGPEGLLIRPSDRFAIVRARTVEQAATVIESVFEKSAADVVALDSLASMATAEEVEGKQQPGSSARALSRLVKKVVSAQAAAYQEEGVAPTLLCSNQYRTNINMMNPKADPRKAAGGFAVQYGNMQEWSVYSRYNDGLTDRSLEYKYADMTYKVKKDKQAGLTNSQASVRLFLKDFSKNRMDYKAGETNNPETLFSLIKDIAEQTGDDRWYSKPKATKIRLLGREFTSAQATKEFLRRPDIAYLIQLPIFAQLLPAGARAHLTTDRFSYSPFADDEPIMELINETQGLIGQNAERDVGQRSWMDERYAVQPAAETEEDAEAGEPDSEQQE